MLNRQQSQQKISAAGLTSLFGSGGGDGSDDEDDVFTAKAVSKTPAAKVRNVLQGAAQPP
jgi:hypothetical protein